MNNNHQIIIIIFMITTTTNNTTTNNYYYYYSFYIKHLFIYLFSQQYSLLVTFSLLKFLNGFIITKPFLTK